MLMDVTTCKGGLRLGKKHRNRINSPKKNNHVPKDTLIAEAEAHDKEYSAEKRKK
jgi:hypothetical protein